MRPAKRLLGTYSYSFEIKCKQLCKKRFSWTRFLAKKIILSSAIQSAVLFSEVCRDRIIIASFSKVEVVFVGLYY